MPGPVLSTGNAAVNKRRPVVKESPKYRGYSRQSAPRYTGSGGTECSGEGASECQVEVALLCKVLRRHPYDEVLFGQRAEVWRGGL